jgi:ABC-type branched-subunit amino acid transport system ATPase component
MLEVARLSVSYGAHRALENVSIRVGKQEICVILGANGAGKSTLIKAVAGLVAKQPGCQIELAGASIAHARPDRIVEAGLALVPEGRGIFADLTVAENLQLGAYGRRARSTEELRRGTVFELFPRLAERRNQIARTMSGGEQQMVAVGRALMSNPIILMMDEPSLGLSPLLTRELFRSLEAVRATGVGILLVEQNARQSLAIADRGYLIGNGRIVGEGSATDLAGDPAVQIAYLGGGKENYRRLGESVPVALVVRSNMTGRSAMKQADELSAKAPELAVRASEIQLRHLQSLRPGSETAPAAAISATVESAPGDAAQSLAARAAAIQAAHLQALRERDHADAPDRKKKKKKKKSAKGKAGKAKKAH